MIEVENTPIEGLKIIRPKVFFDQRGYFFESYSCKEFNEKVAPTVFLQDNQSKSSRGVARGLHFQLPPFAQAKLVRCVVGEVLDIAVDIRKGSPTYGRHFAVELKAEEQNQFFIPRGFAHGFVVLSNEAVFQYKCDNYYAPGHEGGLDILDSEIGLNIERFGHDLLLSDKDRRYPGLKNFDSPFVLGENC